MKIKLLRSMRILEKGKLCEMGEAHDMIHYRLECKKPIDIYYKSPSQIDCMCMSCSIHKEKNILCTYKLAILIIRKGLKYAELALKKEDKK